jgi:hypothetical protein
MVDALTLKRQNLYSGGRKVVTLRCQIILIEHQI